MHKHNLKKVVAVIAVLAMTLGTMITGFAATQTVGLNPAKDIAGTKYADAAARLQALDIMNGYPDGTFKLDNPVSRTEIATIVDRASGLEGAAKLAGNKKPAFKDINASHHWAWGYINTAVSNGIVNGYPNKTFKPTGNVTFAEASAMFVRALGYEPSVGGAWPTNYLSKAAQIGVLDGVSAEPNAAATRGQIAVMMDNALDIKMMERSTYGDTAEYVVGDKTLLTDKLGIDKIEGKVVESPAISGRANEVKIELDKINNKDAKKDTTKTYDVVKAINPDILLGLDITAWVNKSGAIFYAEYEDSQVKYDTVKEVNADKGTIKLTVADRSYDADDATIYVNGKEADLDDLSTKTTLYGTFAFDGKKVVMANLQQFNEADGDVVTKVDKDEKLVTAFDESGAMDEIDLTDPDDGYTITDAKGASMEIGDIKANDVIYVADFDDVYHVVVVSNAATGKLAKMKATSLTVDDKSYDVADNATYSLNKDEDIKKYNVENNDIVDAAGEDVTALLDINGNVRHLTTEVNVRAANYGLVTLVDVYGDRIKLYDPAQDKTVSYDFDGKIYNGEDNEIKISELKTLTGTTGDNYVVAKYDLDKDNVITDLRVFGTIEENTLKNEKDYEDLEITPLDNIAKFDEDHDWIKTDDKDIYYYMSSSTPIVGITDGDVDTAKWDDIKGKSVDDVKAAVVYDAKDDVKFLVITEGFDSIAGTTNNLGVVLNTFIDSDGDRAAEIAVWDGKTADYKLDENVSKGDVINFKLNKDNEVTNVNDITMDSAEEVTAKGSGSLDIDGVTYKVNSKTLYFDATDGMKQIDDAKASDINTGDYVQIKSVGKLAQLVVKVDKDTEAVNEKGIVTGFSNNGKAIEVDGNVYKIDATTRLVKDGKTIAMGPAQIKKNLNVGDKVTIKDNVITLGVTAKEIKAAAQAVYTEIGNLPHTDKMKNETYADDKAAIETARKHFGALTPAEKDALADLDETNNRKPSSEERLKAKEEKLADVAKDIDKEKALDQEVVNEAVKKLKGTTLKVADFNAATVENAVKTVVGDEVSVKNVSVDNATAEAKVTVTLAKGDVKAIVTTIAEIAE